MLRLRNSSVRRIRRIPAALRAPAARALVPAADAHERGLPAPGLGSRACIKARKRMLEGCVTVLYSFVTVGFALVSVLATLSGSRDRLQWCDALWPLLLAIAAVVYVAGMALAAQGRACRDCGDL